MRMAPLTLSCLVGASLVAPAAAEDFHRVVAGLNYRVADGADAPLVQAVRLRPDTGQVLVRYANAKVEWVDAERLAALPQPVATDAGSYLFVVAALACLLDRDGCVRGPATRPLRARVRDVSQAEDPRAPREAASPAGGFTKVRASSSPEVLR